MSASNQRTMKRSAVAQNSSMLRRISIAQIAIWILVGQIAEPSALRADQPRDWMFVVQEPGTYLNTDVVLPGLQAQLEHRSKVRGTKAVLIGRSTGGWELFETPAST